MVKVLVQKTAKGQNVTIKKIQDCNQEDLAQFTSRFKEFIQPVYGDQSRFLEKIFSAEDRTALLLFEGSTLVGIGVFKTHLSNEYAEYSVKEGIEIKTFVVFPENKILYGYYSSILFNRIAQEAIQLGAACLFGTVSEMKSKHMSFFKKMGFTTVKTFSNFQKSGKNENLICNRSPFNLWETTDSFINKYESRRLKAQLSHDLVF